MKRLAIVTTHPIQYYAPVFRLLQERHHLEIKVYYTLGESGLDKYDEGFRKRIKWDISLLDGYPYEWANNTAIKPTSAKFGGIVTPGLNCQISEWNPDAVLFYGWAYRSHLDALRYFKNKVPVYFRGDSTLLDDRQDLVTKLKNLFKRWVYTHVDYAFYTGSANKSYFKYLGLKESQLFFAPHAIDNERFSKAEVIKINAIRNKFLLDREDILILFAGKFEEKKDPLLLLNAFIRLNAEDVHILFVGNGELEGELKQASRGNSKIHFLDFCNQLEMPSVYHAADLFCLPSRGPGETWGLAVNEAMACQKAVMLSTKVGCAADLVVSGGNGDIFEAGNLNDLVNKLQELIDQGKNGITTMGQESGQIIERWNFYRQVEAIENAINEK